jgi:hypothetical protein
MNQAAPIHTRPVRRPQASMLVLEDFDTVAERGGRPTHSWVGFSDRVMGGISDGELHQTVIGGRACLRLTGRVTRAHGGGFVQLAMTPAGSGGRLDASGYAGLELLVFGNDERYNVHIRTPDCRWHEHSYRASFVAPACWERVRLPWAAFEPNALAAPLDLGRILRVGILGWMREFDADIAVGGLSLYR